MKKIIKYSTLVAVICLSNSALASSNDITEQKSDRDTINEYIAQHFNLDTYKHFYQPFPNWLDHLLELENSYIYDQDYSYDDTYTSSVDKPEIYEENTTITQIGSTYIFENTTDETKKITAADLNNRIGKITLTLDKETGFATIDRLWSIKDLKGYYNFTYFYGEAILNLPGVIENLVYRLYTWPTSPNENNKFYSHNPIDKSYTIDENRYGGQTIIEIAPHSSSEVKIYLNLSKVKGGFDFITPMHGDVSVFFNAVGQDDTTNKVGTYYDQSEHKGYVAKFSVYDLLDRINLNIVHNRMPEYSSLPDNISLSNDIHSLVLLKGHGTYYTEEATSVKVVKQAYDSKGDPIGVATTSILATKKI
ncbi:hypothetical protein [Allofrancisella frigidaquae]|uniref:Uncharacterized protein n=1 Tax=Allofrancisella frigidaquae TaxID=1085644 RepID=A0A6M3HVD0_9GAMM|nr:hypothetical protein [Allofrancisella frigidaquae]QIV94041.1 hypothetical protein E3E15_01180 [Allofrancisella frigidaquae]